MPNQYVNKVQRVVDGSTETIMDISSDTVSAESLASGYTAHAANGAQITGTLVVPPPMTVLSYGHSTWQDFITAFDSNTIVYCKASSNSNPGTGTQGRMAFMAYLSFNSSGVPTSVEFQYYRSVSSHTASQQGDQVFVYTLNSSGTWSVTTREASSNVVAGSGIASSYENGSITLSLDSHTHAASDVTSGQLAVANGGTGVSTAAAERDRLGLGNTTGALPIDNGGTGADTAAGARSNLDVYSTGDMDTAIAGKVSKSGDTMTGALTVEDEVTATDANDAVHNLTEKVDKSGDTISGTLTANGTYFCVKNTNIDRDGANPSETVNGNARFFIRDKDGEFIGQMRMAEETSGRMSLQLMVGNENSENSEVTNTIGIRVDKDGVRSYTLSDAAAFCDALGIGTTITKDVSSAVSVASSTYKSISSITVTPGIWLFTGSVHYASNATGRRFLTMATAADVTATGGWLRGSAVSANAVNGSDTRLHTSMTATFTVNTTIYLTAWQNSGSALNATGYFRAVKVSS